MNPLSVTKSELERLTAGNSEPLIMDKTKKARIVGARRTLEHDQYKRLTVARYFGQGRQPMTEVVQRDFKTRLGLLQGHVEIESGILREVAAPEFSATLYVGENAVSALVTIRHDHLEPFNPTARGCYRAANTVGLGDNWTESLWEMISDEEGEQFDFEFETRLAPSQVTRLNETLQEYKTE